MSTPSPVGQILRHGLGQEPEILLSETVNPDGSISGEFFHGGVAFNYEIDGDGLEYEVNQERTDYASGYIKARVDSLYAINCDEAIAWEYFKARIGARSDALNCQNGGVPCGGRCLPAGQKCRLGQRIGGLLKGLAGGMKRAGSNAVKMNSPLYQAKAEVELKAKLNRAMNEAVMSKSKRGQAITAKREMLAARKAARS